MLYQIKNLLTVFPHIVAAATILFWNLRCGNYSREETINFLRLLLHAKNVEMEKKSIDIA